MTTSEKSEMGSLRWLQLRLWRAGAMAMAEEHEALAMAETLSSV